MTTTAPPAPIARSGLTIDARHARLFEPTGLGPLHPTFLAFLRKIANRRQSETLQIIERERTSRCDDRSLHSLAYQLTLSVLADYIVFGNYPVVSNGRCFLIPVLESLAISQNKRRDLARQLFCRARDRSIADRDQFRWLSSVIDTLTDENYNAEPVVESIAAGPPKMQIREAKFSTRALDERSLWRAVRTTWSMGVDSSAPGREIAFLGFDNRYPNVPLGIAQFRNVVPEIVARDRWLGVTAYVDTHRKPHGFLRFLTENDANDRLRATRNVLNSLLTHVNTEGIPGPVTLHSDPHELHALASSKRALFNDLRRQEKPGAKASLMVVKRAETAADLIRGLRAIDTTIEASSSPIDFLIDNPTELRNLNAGLKKIWHYHMGFVAIEMSVCGAAPPFGPLRLGKLMACIAASKELMSAWGYERPLGEIAAGTYLPSVRQAVPNPGPLVVFTSGLYPGHSAQYNRLKIDETQWHKIGQTVGYGSFHVSLETSKLASAFNQSVDGYKHITRAFGEGASARFREVGRAINRLELPDLLRHEMARPLYALPLVRNPQGSLLGWETQLHHLAGSRNMEDLTRTWWDRWVAPRSADLRCAATDAPDLRSELADILQSATYAASGKSHRAI